MNNRKGYLFIVIIIIICLFTCGCSVGSTITGDHGAIKNGAGHKSSKLHQKDLQNRF